MGRNRAELPTRRIIFALVLALATPGCQKPGGAAATEKGAPGGPGGKKGPQAFPVEVKTVETRTLEYSLDALGSVIAFEEAQVTARVAGTVEWVAFAEGDVIAPDQILAEIEPKRFKLAVQTAHAAIGRTQAALDDAKKTYARKKQMGPEVATGEEIDLAQGKVRVAEAEIAQGKATLELAELNLRDARVRAGVAGIVQARKIQTGQYVQPGTVLATVLRVEPLRIKFAVPEPDAQRLLPGMPVQFEVRGLPGKHDALIKHIAGRADEASRQVEILADISGDHAGMRPGAFAQVTIPVGAPWPSPVAPQTAIRPSEKGFVAFVIELGEPPKARERILELGMRTAEGMVEVKKGLVVGDLLVVTGAEALREGVQVRISGGKDPGKPMAIDATPSSDGQRGKRNRSP